MIVYPSIDPARASTTCWPASPGRSKPTIAAWGAISIASAPTRCWRARATWIGKPPPIPARSRCANSLANRSAPWKCSSTATVPPELDAWFEHAVDCCAFLAWRLSSQGASIHFRSNGYDLRQPEEGDIYTILKYLALVYPQKASGPEAPLDDTSYKIVFTPSPRQFIEAGWMDARLLSPDVLPLPPGGQRRPGSRIETGGINRCRRIPTRQFLGDRAPWEVIDETAGRLKRSVRLAWPRAPSIPPRPESGAPRQIVCHLADCEIVFAFRLRQALSQENHVIQPFDQDPWATTLRCLRPATALAVFMPCEIGMSA